MTAPTDPTTTAPPSILDEHRSSPGLLLALLGQEAMRRLRAAHTAHNLKPRQFQILGLLHDHGGLAQRELVAGDGRGSEHPRHAAEPARSRRTRQPASATPTTAAAIWSPSRPPASEQLASASRAQKETEDALFASLDDDQREQLRALLIALRDGLAADPEAACTAARPRDEAHGLRRHRRRRPRGRHPGARRRPPRHRLRPQPRQARPHPPQPHGDRRRAHRPRRGPARRARRRCRHQRARPVTGPQGDRHAARRRHPHDRRRDARRRRRALHRHGHPQPA